MPGPMSDPIGDLPAGFAWGACPHEVDVTSFVQRELPEGSPLVDAREACAAGDRKQAELILANLDPNRGNYFSTNWLIHNLLGNHDQEAEVLRPLEAEGVPYLLADFLGYPKFDPRPFPSIMAVLEREGINRPEPPVTPFACPPPAAVAE